MIGLTTSSRCVAYPFNAEDFAKLVEQDGALQENGSRSNSSEKENWELV
jgi:hypothetical protein